MKKRSKSYRAGRILTMIAAAVFFCVVPAPADDDKKVVPVAESYAGLSYGEWAAAWWQWAFHIPATADYPLSPGGNTLLAQSGPVWFLAGVFGIEVRQITIPSGIALFLPVINAECSLFEPPPFQGDDATSLAACANGHVDNTKNLVAEIDGKPIKNLERFRIRSPMFTVGPVPEPNILSAPKGTITQSVDAGVYLLVLPMKPGRHTIHFGGTFTVLGGTIDTTYKITVTP
jgi:hypothetical protein